MFSAWIRGCISMKNKLTDLNDHLFMQLERLNDESLTGAELEQECTRARAMADIATHIIANANTQIAAAKTYVNSKIYSMLYRRTYGRIKTNSNDLWNPSSVTFV